jgi:Spy/CpxP family protein refolding chaperone
MKNALGIIGIATLTMVGLSGEVMAQGRGPGPGGPGRRMAALDLTAQQRQQIDQLRVAAAKQSEPLRAQMARKRDELRNLWRVDQPDKSGIAQKQAELDAIRVQQRAIWTDLRYQVHGVLNPEQRSKWADWGGPGMGGGHGGHGRGFGHGGPRGGGFGRGGFARPDCPMRAQ